MTKNFQPSDRQRQIRRKILPDHNLSLDHDELSQKIKKVRFDYPPAIIKSAVDAANFFSRIIMNRERMNELNNFFNLIHIGGGGSGQESLIEKFLSPKPSYPLNNTKIILIQESLMSLPIYLVYELIDKAKLNETSLQRTEDRIRFVSINWVNKNENTNQFINNLYRYHDNLQKNKDHLRLHQAKIVVFQLNKVLSNKKQTFLNLEECMIQLEQCYYQTNRYSYGFFMKSPEVAFQKDLVILIRFYALQILSMQINQMSSSHQQERALNKAIASPLFYQARNWYGLDHHTDSVSIIKQAKKRIADNHQKNQSIELWLSYNKKKKFNFSKEFIKEFGFYAKLKKA